MKQAKPDGRIHPAQLLDLWMGHPESVPPKPQRGRRPPAAMVLVAGLIGLVVLVALLKYALDILFIVVVLTVVGLVIHTVGLRLAESDILSPSWLLILILAVALFTYAFLVPTESLPRIERYMPNWMLAAIEWSEERGWAGRVLTGPGGSGTSRAVSHSDGATVSRGATSSSERRLATIVLSSSSQTSVQGQPVTLMARVMYGVVGQRAASIRFYDGHVPLGAATITSERGTQIAYLTVRGLAVGTHQIRATLEGALGGISSDIQPLQVTVVRR